MTEEQLLDEILSTAYKHTEQIDDLLMLIIKETVRSVIAGNPNASEDVCLYGFAMMFPVNVKLAQSLLKSSTALAQGRDVHVQLNFLGHSFDIPSEHWLYGYK